MKNTPTTRKMASNKMFKVKLENARSDLHRLSMASTSTLVSEEQSQKMRSLHQIMELPGSFDLAHHERSLGQNRLPYNYASNAANHTFRHIDETVAEEREPNGVTSLLRGNMTGREYGTASQNRRGKASNFRHILCLQPTLLHRFRRTNGKQTTPPMTVTGDRRNEFFALKRFIFMTLGMPSTPAIPSRMQKLSTCLAIPFYLAAFVWGIGIFVVALQSDGWIWSNSCPKIIPAKLLTMFSGLFFMLLGLFWLLVLWWSRPSRKTLPQEFRNFSTIALIWWILCMYFVGVAMALVVEVYEQRNLIATLGNTTNGNTTNSNDSRSMTVICEGGGMLEVPNNMVPLWALCSMLSLWLLYIAIFVVAIISIYII